MMSGFDNGELQVDVVQEMRTLAERGADIPELVELLQNRLDLRNGAALFPVFAYFRAAFRLSLREVLPLREWLGGQDRSEVDSILIPAMLRTKEQWRAKNLMRA